MWEPDLTGRGTAHLTEDAGCPETTADGESGEGGRWQWGLTERTEGGRGGERKEHKTDQVNEETHDT